MRRAWRRSARILAAFAVLFSVAAMSACGGVDDDPTVVAEPTAAGVTDADASDVTVTTGDPPGFDQRIAAMIGSVPVSEADPGPFPYLRVPSGHRAGPTEHSPHQRAPFWVEDAFHWVEGETHQGTIFPGDGDAFSESALRVAIQAQVLAMGGVELSRVPHITVGDAVAAGLDADLRERFRTGLGHFYARPVSTYLIRRDDAEIWIHFTAFDAGGSWLVTRGSGAPLTEVELARLIEADGRVAVHLRFDSGQAQLLDTAQPQLDRVAELLRRDPGLRLAVEGHTDASGDEVHNTALSEQRAAAVVEALLARGIAADRLESRGHGAAEPAADNATAEGRARNRRVELVRQ